MTKNKGMPRKTNRIVRLPATKSAKLRKRLAGNISHAKAQSRKGG